MLEDASVLDGTLVLEGTSVAFEGILVVAGGMSVIVLEARSVVFGGTSVEVEESVSLELVKVAERQSVVTARSGAENGKSAHETGSKWKMATPSIPSNSTLRESV